MHERKVCNICVFCLIVMVLTVVDQKHRKEKNEYRFCTRIFKQSRESKPWFLESRNIYLKNVPLSSSDLLIFPVLSVRIFSSHISLYSNFLFFISSLHRHISLPHTFITYCTHKHFSTVRPTWTLSHADAFLHSSFFTNTFTNSSFLHAEAATH